MKRSDASERLYASAVSLSGIAWPKETVAGLRRPPHASHRGAFSPDAILACTGSRSNLLPQLTHATPWLFHAAPAPFGPSCLL